MLCQSFKALGKNGVAKIKRNHIQTYIQYKPVQTYTHAAKLR